MGTPIGSSAAPVRMDGWMDGWMEGGREEGDRPLSCRQQTAQERKVRVERCFGGRERCINTHRELWVDCGIFWRTKARAKRNYLYNHLDPVNREHDYYRIERVLNEGEINIT